MADNPLIAVLRAGLARAVRARSSGLTSVGPQSGWFGILRESYAGAFSQNVTIDAPRNILAFSAVYACVTLIAGDAAKLRLKLMVEGEDGVGRPVVSTSPFWPFIRKPNHYQNRLQFVTQWVMSKLLYGNTYALKVRDARGIVVRLYILDAQKVTTLVAPDDGGVYYNLSVDGLAGIPADVTVPGTEMIHDIMNPLWHPLVGVSPLYACGVSATMGNRIQANSTRFFGNASRPSGALTAPGAISDETAVRLKSEWQENFGGQNIGKLAVLGDGLKYEAMTIPATEAQLLEQLDWTVGDVARAYHMPLWKIGGTKPDATPVQVLNQIYYADCLQAIIEALEICLDEGLGLPPGYYTELDLEGLMRMDTEARYKAKGQAVKDGWMKPDEARRGENLESVPGGDTPYLQQQNFSLAALAKRDAKDDPFASRSTAQGQTPSANDETVALVRDFVRALDAV